MTSPNGSKETDIGRVPCEWSIGTVDDFCKVVDCRHVTAEFVMSGIPVASIGEVQSRYVDLSSAKNTTDEFYQHLIGGDRKPKPGDLIFSRNATVGEVAQVTKLHPPFAMGQDVCLIRKKNADDSSDYIQSVIQSQIVGSQLENMMVGSTFRRVNVRQIKSLVIPIPHPTEQRAIAEALSDVDALINALDALITKKRHIKQGTMQQLLTGKKRLLGFSGEWEEKMLGELGTFFSGGTPSTSVDSYYDGGTVPWITSSDCNSGRIRYVAGRITQSGLDNSASKMIAKGSLLVALYGATAGVVAVSEIEAAINQAVLAGELRQADSSFVFHKLTMLKDWIITTYTQGGQPNLSGSIVKSIVLSLPDLDEQKAIATVLDDMDAEITVLKQKRDKTKLIKQGMMQELLTGKTRLI